MSYSIGIDLGGSSIKAVAVTVAGEVLGRSQIEFEVGEKMDWAEKIRALLQRMQAEQGFSASCLGLSAPGLAAPNGRSIAYMPGRLQGLENLDWTDYLEAANPVPVLNDGHAALLGESWLGAGRGFQNVIMITLGTGVGGAAMVDGRLLRGEIGRAGHLGHASLNPDGPPDICGSPGSLEVAVGNCTIADRSNGRFQSTHELIAAYQAGDNEAAEIWLRSVQYLACAICSFVNILDPKAVIIGGGIARAGQALFEPLQRYLEPIEWSPGGHRVRLLPAELGEYAGAFGAAYHGACQEI